MKKMFHLIRKQISRNGCNFTPTFCQCNLSKRHQSTCYMQVNSHPSPYASIDRKHVSVLVGFMGIVFYDLARNANVSVTLNQKKNVLKVESKK